MQSGPLNNWGEQRRNWCIYLCCSKVDDQSHSAKISIKNHSRLERTSSCSWSAEHGACNISSWCGLTRKHNIWVKSKATYLQLLPEKAFEGPKEEVQFLSRIGRTGATHYERHRSRGMAWVTTAGLNHSWSCDSNNRARAQAFGVSSYDQCALKIIWI